VGKLEGSNGPRSRVGDWSGYLDRLARVSRQFPTGAQVAKPWRAYLASRPSSNRT